GSMEFDYLALGGLSILTWLIFIVFSQFRGDSQLIESRYLQIPIVFAWLSFFCNFPHFLASYKVAYTRKSSFIIKHWFQLIAIPIFFILLYIFAYFNFHQDVQDSSVFFKFNHFMDSHHLNFSLGNNVALGTEIVIFTIRTMYVLVGWHYAKQVFGCSIITLRLNKITLQSFDRFFFKYTLYSVSIFNFLFFSIPEFSTSSPSYFYNIPMQSLGLSPDLLLASKFFSLTMIAVFLIKFTYSYYSQLRAEFPTRAAITFFSFIIWWLPPVRQYEYSLYAIPFFHSLQYLIFIHKIEGNAQKSGRNFIVFGVLLILAGVLVFELIPNLLDIKLNTITELGTIFFYIAFPVFINIHHFFIDNCIWKLSDKEVRERILN
ncbi:MAG: hypothetical protein K2Q18_13785, partial [Bdellovibrionales bacterium]|nr:hypothetical protein [Bdellovibrionales bacterium]